MIKVVGYKIREALKRHELRKKTIITEFEDSLHVFEGETKQKPADLMAALQEVTENLAFLQEIQEWYNTHMRVNFEGHEISLSMAIKLIGSIDSMEKLWRKATGAFQPAKDLWGARRGNQPLTRSKEHDYAKKNYTMKEAADAADKTASRANVLRALIAQVNALPLSDGSMSNETAARIEKLLTN